MKSRSPSGGLVYSTDSGRMCPTCRQAKADCRCAVQAARPAGDGVVRVSRETKGRAGKGVTLVRGLALDPLALMTLGKQLKTACGSQAQRFSPSKEFDRNPLVYKTFIRYLRDDERYALIIPDGDRTWLR